VNKDVIMYRWGITYVKRTCMHIIGSCFTIITIALGLLGLGNNGLHYWQEFGPARIIPHEKVYADLNQGLDFDKDKVSHKIIVVITSTQSDKQKACKTIFTENPRFSETSINFIALTSKSDIAPQPLGTSAAELGATNRIKYLKKQNVGLDENITYYCSIESFFTAPDIYEPRDHAFIVIQDPKLRMYRYISNGVMVSPAIYDAALDYGGMSSDGSGSLITIGEILAKQYQVDPQSWHKYITQDKYSRYKQIISALETTKLF